MATERLAPDGLTAQSGHSSCALGDLTSDPDSSDANWCVASNNNTDTDIHVTFPTPSGNPTVGADLQEIRLEVRRTSGSGTGTPQARIEVWENGGGSPLVTGSNTDVTSDTSQVISLTFNANVLGTADGSLLEVKCFGVKSGGSPSARSAVDMGGVEWNVDYTAPTAQAVPATTTVTPALERVVNYSRALAASSTATASMAEQAAYGISVAATSTVTPDIAKTSLFFVPMAVAVGVTVGFQRLVDMTLAVSTSVSAAIGRVYTVTMDATTTVTATMQNTLTAMRSIGVTSTIGAILDTLFTPAGGGGGGGARQKLPERRKLTFDEAIRRRKRPWDYQR